MKSTVSRIQKRLYDILELTDSSDPISKAFNYFMMALITLNVVAVVLETVSDLSVTFSTFFRLFETASVIVFTLEYCIRLWVCPMEARFAGTFVGRVRYAISPMALVDLAAILPFYLPMMIPLDLRFIRILRMMRLFRLFKIGRYTESLQTLGSVLRLKTEELLITAITILILLVLASGVMYQLECEEQPEAFSSIPATMWWGVVTLTTVGYGDVAPVTPLGKLIGAIIALLGIGMFAMPAGIIASGFAQVMRKRRTKCPHCGQQLE